MRPLNKPAIVIVVLVAAVGVALRGQEAKPLQPPSQVDTGTVFRSDTRLVVLHATVVDKSGHLVTNLATFHLQRHSDHHAHPSRRYQSLRHFEDLPQLPSGYFGMFPLAYVPALWFRVMNPRLLALPHVQGDLGRVNVDPRRSAELHRRYGRAAALPVTPTLSP